MGDSEKIKKKDKKEKKDKSEKKNKDKKEKLLNADENRVHKSDKDKEKKKKEKLKKAALDFLDEKNQKVKKEEKDESLTTKAERVVPVPSVNAEKMEVDSGDELGDAGIQPVTADGEGRALVPFAFPLANEKLTKKSLKTVKKAAKSKCLKRGVKEVVKALRKCTPGSGIVILAADISPMDVISHIPVLCEDHNIPYLFVNSRAELGAAGGTKRPTSVVMIVPGIGKGKKPKKGKDGEEVKPTKDDEKNDNDLKEAYDELVKAVEALPKMK